MKIAIIGAGAMGMLYGGYLSKTNEVALIVTTTAKAEHIMQHGVRITEQNGSAEVYFPAAQVSGQAAAPVDLVIVQVKAMHTQAALEANRALIGSDTWLMTLQNGSGHDRVLRQFAADDRIIIGVTQHNSSVSEQSAVFHGGSGKTAIGSLTGDAERLRPIADCLAAAGFECELSQQIQRIIWRKLFTNTSSSVLSGALQTAQGFVISSQPAWELTEMLIREAVRVANGDGMAFDEDEIVSEIRGNLERSPNGITSICADLRDGRATEVDTISGSVVNASRRNGVPAPTHETMVRLVHALEDRHRMAAEVSST